MLITGLALIFFISRLPVLVKFVGALVLLDLRTIESNRLVTLFLKTLNLLRVGLTIISIDLLEILVNWSRYSRREIRPIVHAEAVALYIEK